MGLLQAREKSHAAEVAKLELKLSERDNELSASRRAVKVGLWFTHHVLQLAVQAQDRCLEGRC